MSSCISFAFPKGFSYNIGMSENKDTTEAGPPIMTRRKFLKALAGGAVAATRSRSILSVTGSILMPEVTQQDILASLKQLNQDILDTQPSSDPKELQQWYILAKDRQKEMIRVLIEHPNQARVFIEDGTNVQAREKLETLLIENEGTMKKDIFETLGQAEVTGIKGLTERKVSNLSGTAYKVADEPTSPYKTTLNSYTTDLDQLDFSPALYTNQKLEEASRDPKMQIAVEGGYLIANVLVADNNAVKLLNPR